MQTVESSTNAAKPELKIRRVTIDDVAALGKLGSELILQHYAYDAQRFSLFEPLENNYADFLAAQIENANAIVLVAELNEQIAGYALVRLEPNSFVDALAAGAWLHDIYVAQVARGVQLGAHLLSAATEAARELGSSSLMLSVSPRNVIAQKLFAQFGFRQTMQEMRLDFENKK